MIFKDSNIKFLTLVNKFLGNITNTNLKAMWAAFIPPSQQVSPSLCPHCSILLVARSTQLTTARLSRSDGDKTDSRSSEESLRSKICRDFRQILSDLCESFSANIFSKESCVIIANATVAS